MGAKPINFPTEKNHKLTVAIRTLLNDATQYRKLVGRLIYLAITRPELTYVVHIESYKFMQSPKEDHMEVAR